MKYDRGHVLSLERIAQPDPNTIIGGIKMKDISRAASVIAKAREELEQLKKEEGARYYSATFESGIQMGFDEFVELFKDFDFETEQRNSLEYPYEVTTTIEGVEVFAIASENDYKEVFPEALTPQERYIKELEAKVAELQGGENL